MAVTFVGADLSNSANVIAVTGLNWPAHAAGDVALFGGGTVDTATPVLDANFTQLRQDIDQNLKGTLAWRSPASMTGSESGAISFTVGSAETNRMVAGVAIFRGCSGIGTPTYLAEGGTAVSTHSSPSVSLASANDGILLIYVERQSTSASTITPPTGYTDAGQFGTGGSGGTVMCLAYKVAGNSAGTNNPSTWSSTNTASNCEVYAIPLTAASTSTTVTPDGIASGEAWGTPGAALVLTISPSGIGSGEAWGTPSLALNLTVSPTGIASGEAWGTPGLTFALTVSPTGISSGEAWGTPGVSATLTVSPTGIPSAEAWGTPGISGLLLSPTGIPSGEAWGTPAVQTTLTVAPTGIPSAVAFGVPGAALSLQVSPVGIASGVAWGVPGASASLTVSPTGIASGESWGTPAVSIAQSTGPFGIASAVAWGNPTVGLSLVVAPIGISTGEAWGAPTVTSAAPAVQRNITLTGAIEPNRFAGGIEPGRLSGSIEPNRLSGVVLWPDQ